MNPYFKFLATFRKNLTAEQKKLPPKEIAIPAGKAYREQKKKGLISESSSTSKKSRKKHRKSRSTKSKRKTKRRSKRNK